MMWKGVKNAVPANSEPEELRSLKTKLASLDCKCFKCNKFQTHFKRKLHEKDNEKGIQVETLSKSNVQLANNETLTEDGYLPESSIYRKDLLCPSCYLTLSILKGGVIKVLKDEELETNFSYFSRDKATEQTVPLLEKTTSLTYKPVLKYTNPSYYDTISELTSIDSLVSSRNRSPREVTFTMNTCYYSDEDLPSPSSPEQSYPSSPEPVTEHTTEQAADTNTTVANIEPLPFGTGFCIDTYINSIRPPFAQI